MTISKKLTRSMLSNNSFPCTSVIHGFEKSPEAVIICSELNTMFMIKQLNQKVVETSHDRV